MTKFDNDGGYYAIKGFAFQIDKAILELLNSRDEFAEINIEQIQDINLKDSVIQVKYKETAKLIPSQVNKPISQLIEEFKNDGEKKYVLYAYFKDFNGYNEKVDENKNISIQTLDELLGSIKDEFTLLQKQRFVKKFKLDFSPNFQNQFNKIIAKLEEESFVSNYDEAVFYYANIVEIIIKVIINNPIKHGKSRVVTKKKVFDYLMHRKKLVFNSAYKAYLGEKKYLSFVKDNFIYPIKNQENYIFLGNIKLDTSTTVGKLIIDVTEKYFNRAKRDIKPITFIVSDKYVDAVKKDIIGNNFSLNDGFESIYFSPSLFFKHPIINKKYRRNGSATDSLKEISFKIRLLSNSKFMELTNYGITPQMIYYFDVNAIDAFSGISFLEIHNLDSSRIKELFIN